MKTGTGTTINSGFDRVAVQAVVEPVPVFISPAVGWIWHRAAIAVSTAFWVEKEMKRLVVLWRRLSVWVLLALCWTVMHGTVWAAQPGKEEERPVPYVLPYALVIFGIGLGLVVLLNPSRRRDKARIDPLEERRTKSVRPEE